MASRPIGRLMKKTQRQPVSVPNAWISTPPSSGPMAVETPTTVPNSPNAVPRSRPLNSCWISALICGVSRPPARPCTSRATTRNSAPGARPQASEESVNRASPTTNIVRRPRTSPIRPAGTSSRPKVRAYPETTHCSSLWVADRPVRIDGSATFTIETSSSTMKPPTRQTASARQRCGAGAELTLAPYPGVACALTHPCPSGYTTDIERGVDMPSKKEDLPDTLERSPAKVQRAYEETLDSAHDQYGDEERAHRTAWGSVKNIAEKKGDHWELKDEAGPSDPRSKKPQAAKRRGEGETYGGIDVE